jgi:hypothetical protein
MSSNDPHVKPRPWFSAQAGAPPARPRPAAGAAGTDMTQRHGVTDAPEAEGPLREPAAGSNSAEGMPLSDLEPALQLARQIRRQITAAGDPLPPLLAKNRRDEAMKLLTSPTGASDP